MTSSACLISECSEPRWSTSLLCSFHQGAAQRALWSIKTDSQLIRENAHFATATKPERVAGSRDAVLPGAALFALDSKVSSGAFGVTFGDHPYDLEPDPPVAFLLDQWAQMVSEGRCDLPGPTITELVDFLSSQHVWTCKQRYADDYYDEITTLAAKVAMRAGNHRQVKRGIVPCAACNQRTLMQYEPSTPTDEIDEAGEMVMSGGEWRCRNKECRAIEQDSDYEARVQHLDTAILTTKEAQSA